MPGCRLQAPGSQAAGSRLPGSQAAWLQAAGYRLLHPHRSGHIRRVRSGYIVLVAVGSAARVLRDIEHGMPQIGSPSTYIVASIG